MKALGAAVIFAASLLAYMHCGGLVGSTFVLMGVGGGLLLGDRE